MNNHGEPIVITCSVCNSSVIVTNIGRCPGCGAHYTRRTS